MRLRRPRTSAKYLPVAFSLFFVATASRAGAAAAASTSRTGGTADGNPQPAVVPSKAARDAQIIGPDVYGALREQPRVPVIIAFRQPSRGAGGLLSLPDEAQDIKNRVLSGLDPSDFQPTWQWRSLSAAAGMLTTKGLAKLAADPRVERIDLDKGGTGQLSVSVPFIRANAVQALGITGRGVTVAVLDSGVATTHPDLSDDIGAQQCFCMNADGSGCCPNGQTAQSGPGSAEDDNGHGTNVAGIVTSAGRVAPAGVAPDAKIIAIKVLDRSNSFNTSSQVISGLDWILTNRSDVRVVNMSLGTAAMFSGPCDNAMSFTMAYAQAINALRSRGVIVFAASGNNGSVGQMPAPACVANAISVGAVYDQDFGPFSLLGCSGRFLLSPCSEATAADKLACFTNSGGTLRLLAPGAPITSTGIGGGTSTCSGTSQASPHAAGVAALMLQARPSLTPAEIDAALRQTGKPITDPRSNLMFPRIDALAALNSLGVGSPSICTPDAATLCLNNGRFKVQVTWRVPSQGTGGVGTAAGLTGDTGYFWFFSSNNIEMVIKVVDGRAFNNKFWVFYGALSDVEYAVTVTDTSTGTIRTYFNPSGNLASVADVTAF